jgi:hypothetical protein
MNTRLMRKGLLRSLPGGISILTVTAVAIVSIAKHLWSRTFETDVR